MRLHLLALATLLAAGAAAWAQAPEGTLSDAEISSLRDSAYVPIDRLKTYVKIIDSREKRLDELMAKRHGADFASDVHDAMEQVAAIVDELNDNLDAYSARHRDVRKVLPKLIDATEKWATSLRAPGKDERYEVFRRAALDALKDTRELATTMEAEQATYFKEHPDAAKAERERASDPHAPN